MICGVICGVICKEIRREIGERSHAGKPDAKLADHLHTCADCRAAWDTREDLARHLAALRRTAFAPRSEPGRRSELIRQMALRQQRRKTSTQAWTRAFAMAAALLLMVGIGPRVWDMWASRGAVPAEIAENTFDGDGEEGFIAVPYAPALASGESLRVVRTELFPAALVSLGVDMDPTWTGKMPADLLVGEDGYPRAVRVSTEPDGSF